VRNFKMGPISLHKYKILNNYSIYMVVDVHSNPITTFNTPIF
jgi:hypothetical protein